MSNIGLTVKSIKKVGVKKTYDLHVPIYNNFFLSNGVLSHNSGKSWKCLAMVQSYYEKGYKIFDIYGGKRKEGPFWCFPSEEKKLWFEFEQEVGIMTSPGPKEYQVDLLYPCFSSKIPRRLPQHLPRIDSKIFTLSIEDITIDDISLVIGNTNSTSIYVWNTIVKELGKKGNGEDIKNLMDTKLKKYKEYTIYRNFIKPLIDNHFISESNCELRLDLQMEAKNKERICVLCDDYIPDEFRWFILGYFRRKLMELVMSNKIHKKNIGVYREVSAFMKVQDKNKQGEEQVQIFRNQLSDGARYARSGFFMFMDTQSPREVKGLISGQDDLTSINEMPSPADREELCDQLKRDKRMTARQVSYLYNIPIHQTVVVARGQKAKLIKRVMPPRNQCWKPTMGNFLSYWKLRYNSWKMMNKDLDLIFENYRLKRVKINIKKSDEGIDVTKGAKNDAEVIKIREEMREEKIKQQNEPIQI